MPISGETGGVVYVASPTYGYTKSTMENLIVETAMRSGDTEFVARVPDFMRLAESRLNRSLRVRQMEQNAIVDVTTGTGVLPDDYLQYRRVYVDGKAPMEGVDSTWALSRYPSSSAGDPCVFYIRGSSITVAPSYTGEIILDYYQAIPTLTDDDPTNWVLDGLPNLYLYGALVEAEPYMFNDPRIQTWGTMFDRSINDLRREDIGSRYARAGRRVPGPTP